MNEITELLDKIEAGYAKQNPPPSTATAKKQPVAPSETPEAEASVTTPEQPVEDLSAQSPPSSSLCE